MDQEEGATSITVRAPEGTNRRLKALRPAFTAEREQARQWRAEQWSTAGLTGREAAARRAQWAAHRERLRRAGTLLDTLSVAVAAGVRAELRDRGWWEANWPPLPNEALIPGRWPGSRDGEWPEKVPLRLPADLVDRTRRACWHTSAEAIGHLRDWRDRWNYPLPTRIWRSGIEEEALREYEALAAEVTTTGEIWRDGLLRAVGLLEARHPGETPFAQ